MSEEHPAAAAAPPRPSVDEIVDRWLADNFTGSIVARNTDAYNHLHEAAQRLKGLLKQQGVQ